MFMNMTFVAPVLATVAGVWLLAASLAGAGAGRDGGIRLDAGETPEPQVKTDTSRRLSENDSIGDLLNHPAFAGFGSLLLPWDDRRYDPSLRLRDIGSLLPYHSHVDPGIVGMASVPAPARQPKGGSRMPYDSGGE